MPMVVSQLIPKLRICGRAELEAVLSNVATT